VKAMAVLKAMAVVKVVIVQRAKNSGFWLAEHEYFGGIGGERQGKGSLVAAG
jgi:hypothetical protein